MTGLRDVITNGAGPVSDTAAASTGVHTPWGILSLRYGSRRAQPVPALRELAWK
jgi:hypothetical protein